MVKPRKPREVPPLTDELRSLAQIYREVAKSEHETHYIPRSRPEIIDEIWARYVDVWLSAEAVYYSELGPLPTEIKLWLQALRIQALEFFAGYAPDRELALVIERKIEEIRTWLENELVKQKAAKIEAEKAVRVAARAKRVQNDQLRKAGFAQKLVWHRFDAGLTQERLAEHMESAMDTSRELEKRNIAEYEAGRSLPTPERLKALAKIFTEYGRSGHVGSNDLLSPEKETPSDKHHTKNTLRVGGYLN